MNLINLPGWTVTGVKANKDDYCVSATYDSGDTSTCEKCSALLLDVPVAGAEEQDNCVIFHDATTYGNGEPSDRWDDFAGTVEAV